MKRFLKRQTQYLGMAETQHIRDLIAEKRHPGWPYCPPDEGDLLHKLASATPAGRGLEIGCATGSTSAYMLDAMPRGTLASVDFAHGDHGRSGEALIARAGFAARHRLIEEDSARVLPRLEAAGERFDIMFLDGWKTFDHVWVDTFYCARMLNVGGYIIFDDARMPAVRKAIALLVNYYKFERVDNYAIVGGTRLRWWHRLTARDNHPPYVALRKNCELNETPAGRKYDFWAKF
jgi:predicted O-methyltransferase YrrM